MKDVKKNDLLRLCWMGVVSAWLVTGCSAAKLSASKKQVLDNKSIFSSSSDGDVGGSVAQSGDTGGKTPTSPAPTNNSDAESGSGPGQHPGAPYPFPSTTTIPAGGSIGISRVCTEVGSNQTTNYQTAVQSNLPIELDVNGQACSTDVTKITTLVKGDSISAASLSSLCPTLASATSSLEVKLLINGAPQSGAFSHMGNGLSIVWARNPQRSPVPSEYADACTDKHSPLVIHLPQNPTVDQALNLSPENALWYDLLGATSGHRKVVIDWFTNLDYRLLALPDRKGEVKGIDQLFGNNTTGPDGKMAANGYLALAKYDLNADGRIDRRDPIFGRLRVWLDKNFDGVSKPDELTSLADAHIDYIDLDYDESHYEVDAYGNETRMKSVVGMTDGTLNMIFDLWFKYSWE